VAASINKSKNPRGAARAAKERWPAYELPALPAQRPAESPAAYGQIIFHGKPMSNMGEKHKGRGKAGKLSVVPILWELQAETDVSTPHLRG